MITASRRRMSLQLTPLLDLLLIVIFAQFMDVERATQTQAESVTMTQQASEDQQKEVSRLEALLLELQAMLKASQEKVEVAEGQANQNKQDKDAAENLIGQLQAQQQLIAGFLKSLFQDTADKLKSNDAAENVRFLDEMTARIARQETERLAKASPEKIIRHVLTYEEVIKRTDLWDIHVTSQGVIVLSTPNRTLEIRSTSPQDFSNQVFAFYKSLSQPKGLVIILYSYGDARADVRQAVELGIPMVAERMRADAGNLTRFEYANLGFQEQSTIP